MNKCPKCGSSLSCLAGHSGHPSNWYCSNEFTCGWAAWNLEAGPANYKKSVLDEKLELDRKLDSPRKFLSSDIYSNLSVDEQSLLAKQERYMLQYSCVLGERILAFKD